MPTWPGRDAKYLQASPPVPPDVTRVYPPLTIKRKFTLLIKLRFDCTSWVEETATENQNAEVHTDDWGTNVIIYSTEKLLLRTLWRYLTCVVVTIFDCARVWCIGFVPLLIVENDLIIVCDWYDQWNSYCYVETLILKGNTWSLANLWKEKCKCLCLSVCCPSITTRSNYIITIGTLDLLLNSLLCVTDSVSTLLWRTCYEFLFMLPSCNCSAVHLNTTLQKSQKRLNIKYWVRRSKATGRRDWGTCTTNNVSLSSDHCVSVTVALDHFLQRRLNYPVVRGSFSF